jgi:chemotaxis methyl-accepting protein methylase
MIALDGAEDRTRHIVFVSDTVAPLSTPPPPLRPAPGPPAPKAAPLEPLDPETARFYRRLFESRGLELERYRPAVLARRKRACLRAMGVASVAEAAAALDRDEPVERDELAERGLQAVMIGVTSFFRDAAMYAALGDLVAARAATGTRGPRVLSVGCSDGAELYSLGILLAERGIPAAEMVGVDCRPAAIEQARRGVYPQDILEDVPAPLRTRYFDAVGGRPDRVRVAASLRERCRWELGDAFTLGGAEPYDIVACRNLAIYLEPAAARDLWAHIWEHTRAGGILVVGKAERPDQASGFRRIGPCLYEKQ